VTRPVRLGAVSYLNVRPLVYGLEHRPEAVTLRFDVPSDCARLLAAGEIDLGMIPSISWLDRPGDSIVPGICIGSDGPVASVGLFTRRPVGDVRTIALDTSSRTSVALVRILCARRFQISPTFVPHSPDLVGMLASADAALVIGDLALFTDHRAHGVSKIDLGAVWTEMTGFPFVWAFWSGRSDAVGSDTVEMLQTAAEDGMAHSDAIAAAYCAGDQARVAIAQRYLRENLAFRLTRRALDGLRMFYREAARSGVVDRAFEPVFFGASHPRSAIMDADAGQSHR
jgi:predicted solute-binding protein